MAEAEELLGTVTEQLDEALAAEQEQTNVMEGSTEQIEQTVTEAQESSMSEMSIYTSIEQSVTDDLERVSSEMLSQFKGTFEAVDEQVQALQEASQVSDETVGQVSDTFDELASKLAEIQVGVAEGGIDIQEAEENINEAVGVFRERIDGVFDEVEDDVQGIGVVIDELKSAGEGLGETLRSSQDVQAGTAGGAGGGGVGAESFIASVEGANLALEKFGGTKTTQTLTKAKGLATKLLGTLSSLASVIATGVVGALLVAVDLIEDAFGAAQEFRSELGVGAERMREFRKLTRQTSTELAGFGLEPGATTEIATQFQEQFGSIQTATDATGRNLEELVVSSGALAESIGVGAGRAAEIQAEFVELEKQLGGSADKALVVTRELARANEVAPQAAFQDITENAEKLAQFSGNTVESLGRASVRAQQLGTSLGSVAEFQEQSLTNITGQLTQIQKANQLLGGQLEGQQLLQASYQGTEATLKEVREQVEGINFENLDFFQRQQLDEALPGFSIQELQRMSEAEERLNEIDTTTQNLAEEVEAGNISVQRALTAGDNVDPTQELTQQFNKLYFVLAEELVPPLVDLADAIIPGLTIALKALGPVISGIGEGLKLLLSPLQLLVGDFEGFKKSISSVIEPMENMLRSLGLMAQKEKEAAESTNFLASSFKLLSTAASAVLSGAWLASLTGAATSVTSALTALGGAIGGLLPSLSGLGASIASLGGTLSSTGVGAIVGGIVAAIGGAIYAFNNWEQTVTFFTSVFDTFIERIFNVKDGIGSLNSIISDAQSMWASFTSWLSEETAPAVETVSKWYNKLYADIQAFLADVGREIQPWIQSTSELFSDLKASIKSVAEDFGLLSMSAVDWGNVIGTVLAAPFEFLIGQFQFMADMIEYELELLGDFLGYLYDIGAAIGTLEGDAIIEALTPDVAYLNQKMKEAANIVKSYIPFSPAERGPLANIDQANIGGEIAKSISPGPIESKLQSVMGSVQSAMQPIQQSVEGAFSTAVDFGSDVLQGLGVTEGEGQTQQAQAAGQPQQIEVTGEGAAEQPMNIQSPSPTTQTQTQQPQQQPSQQQEMTTGDGGDKSVEQLLQQLLQSQKQFNKFVQNNGLPVYLDGRKVNKEMLRSLDVV